MNRGLATIAVLLIYDYGTTIERLYFQKWKELLKNESDYSSRKMPFDYGASIERLSKIISNSTIERLCSDYERIENKNNNTVKSNKKHTKI